MKKIIIAILLTLGVAACQQNNSPETETKESKKLTKPISQEVTKYCTKDLKICPDGNSVSRNRNNNCEFDACAKVKEAEPKKKGNNKNKKKQAMMCTADVKECSDGSFIGRDHYNHCKFKECPNGDKLNKNKI